MFVFFRFRTGRRRPHREQGLVSCNMTISQYGREHEEESSDEEEDLEDLMELNVQAMAQQR